MSVKTIRSILLTTLLAASTVHAAEPETTSYHAVGDRALGGMVFYVTADGTHGLVVANKDQGKNDSGRRTEYCSEEKRFDEAGQAYSDWKLPTRYQLAKLYELRELIGGFRSDIYWSSYPSCGAYINFKNGDVEGLGHSCSRKTAWVRCIRAF